jgi:hypothetical protein
MNPPGNPKDMLILIGFTIGALLMLWALTSCEEEADGCQVEAVRCVVTDDGEEIAQVCNGDQSWQDVMSCSTLEPLELKWECCLVDGGVGCLPQEECSQ